MCAVFATQHIDVLTYPHRTQKVCTAEMVVVVPIRCTRSRTKTGGILYTLIF